MLSLFRAISRKEKAFLHKEKSRRAGEKEKGKGVTNTFSS